jgi:hypothetical protein
LSAGNIRQFDPHVGLTGIAGLPPRALVSVDTDFILDQAAAKLGASIPAARTMGAGSIRSFAPRGVADEIAWTYEAAARHRRVNPHRLLEVVNDQFLPPFRFVDMSPIDFSLDRRLIGIKDQVDRDVAYLGLLLAPSHVFSHDRHLRMPGFAPATIEDLNTILPAGVAVEVSDGALVTTGFAVRTGAAGVSYAGNAIAVRLQIPLWVVGLFAAIVFGLVVKLALSTPERRNKVAQALMTIGAEVAKMADRQALGQALLEQRSLEAPVASLESRIFRALALARQPLLAREIQAAVDPRGGIPTERELRDFLVGHPSFARIGRYRWQLGRQLTIRRPD